LPTDLVETSGVAVSRTQPGLLWTHNDDGSVLYAVDTLGALRASYVVRPRLRDWEDIAIASCESHGTCLYFADTGDNQEQRRPGAARLARVAEPELGPDATDPSELTAGVFPLRFPDGPRDVEALYVLPDERPFLVTKGRNHPVTVYAYPPPLRADTVTLREVQRLGSGPASLPDRVTGASASADGDVVVLRTYQAMEWFEVRGDSLVARDDGRVNLRPLRESQGEGVALGAGGLVVLTSEAGFFSRRGGMNRLRCSF
jgi:hypothetical protein